MNEALPCCGGMAKRATQVLLLFLTLLVVGCDHATKYGAKAALYGKPPLALVSDVVDLRYAENRDTAFSLTAGMHFAGKDALMIAVSLLVASFLGALAWRRRHAAGRVELLGYGLVIAGAAGNLADRVARGYVIDFIHVSHWPVFNVADVAIVLGAIALWVARTRLRAHAQGR